MTAQHQLTIKSIEDGCVYFDFQCLHEEPSADHPEWATHRNFNNHEPDYELGCWLMSWWEGIGNELVGRIDPPYVWPLPVRPNDDWDYEDGGWLVADREAMK